MNTTALLITVGMLSRVVSGATAESTEGDSPQPVAIAALEITEASRPALPPVGLAADPSLVDDVAIVRFASELAKAAEEAEAPLERARLLLAAANHILAYQVEPACSRRLLRMSMDEVAAKPAEVVAAFDRTDRLIQQAETALTDLKKEENPEPSDDAAAGVRKELAGQVQTLRAFSTGLRVYLSSNEGEQGASDVRRAVSLLSPLLEDEDQSVSASATLWQACLRRDDQDISRTLSVLDLALTKPTKETLPYAFFSRLERCRLIAQRGGQSAALTLLMQVEERCEEWFEEEAHVKQAARTAQFVQIQVLADWYDLASTQSPERDAETKGGKSEVPVSDEQKWCVERIEALKSDHFNEETNDLFRLTTAIPIIATAPELPEPASEETTQDD